MRWQNQSAQQMALTEKKRLTVLLGALLRANAARNSREEFAASHAARRGRLSKQATQSIRQLYGKEAEF